MAERLYSGEPVGTVMVREGGETHPLDPRFDLRYHAARFSWGSVGAGAAQLALALLADATGDEDRALALHHRFENRVVAIFPERWTITRSRILAHAEMLEFLDQSDAPHSRLSQAHRRWMQSDRRVIGIKR